MRHSGTHLLPTPSPNNTECHLPWSRASAARSGVHRRPTPGSASCPMPSLLLKRSVVSKPTQAQPPTFSTPQEKRRKDCPRLAARRAGRGRSLLRPWRKPRRPGAPSSQPAGRTAQLAAPKTQAALTGDTRHPQKRMLPTGEDVTHRTHTSSTRNKSTPMPPTQAGTWQTEMRRAGLATHLSLMCLRCPLFG